MSVCACIAFLVLRVSLGDCAKIVGSPPKYKSPNVSCKCVRDGVSELDPLGTEKIDVRLTHLGYVSTGSTRCKITLT